MTTDLTAPPQATTARRLPRLARFRTAETELAAATILLIAVFSLLNPDYLSPASFAQVLVGSAFIGIITLGQNLLLLGAEFDLSVGAVAALSSVLGAMAMVSTGNVLLGIGVCFGVGALAGALNAFCVITLQLPSFISTIGTAFIAGGLAVYITGGDPVYPLPEALTNFGFATPLGLSWTFLIFLFLGLLMDSFIRFTSSGRRVMASGGDASAASIAGIAVSRVKARSFLVCALLAALAGLCQISAQGTAVPTLGTGAELTAVAAAVVGGTSIFGGSGSIAGGMLGVIFLNVVITGLTTVGVSTNWQTFSVGLVMIAAIALDVARRRRDGLLR